MGKLSILGAQRVKALIEVLKDKEEAVIRELRSQLPTDDEITNQADKDFGVYELKQEVKELENRLKELSDQIKIKTGFYYVISSDYRYVDKAYKKYIEHKNKLRKGDIDEKIADIQREFRAKEQKLWLCETLEDAKQIVGIE